MKLDHDHSYKHLFSNPEIVIDLLKGFVHQPWVNELDFSTLERPKDIFITDDLRERIDDVIWRVKHKNRWVYIYLLIEFQSTVDPFMAVRVPLYTLLLYQDLIKTQKLKKNDLLPPVFPVVLYNGEKRWDSSTQLNDLIMDLPGGLDRYQPSFEYMLLDEGAYKTSELEHLNNLVAAIFRLENARSREDIILVMDNLLQWLQAPEQTLVRRSFAIWLHRTLLPSKTINDPVQQVNDLTEIRSMLSHTVSEMVKPWLEQGREEGLEKGLEKEKTLLLRQIRRRFNEQTAFKAQAIITGISSTDALEAIGDWIIDCDDSKPFLAKLEQL